MAFRIFTVIISLCTVALATLTVVQFMQTDRTGIPTNQVAGSQPENGTSTQPPKSVPDTPRIAHIVKFYADPPTKPVNELSFMECVSLLSIMINFKPEGIYYHSNHPDFWPFDSCNPFIANWTEIEIKHRKRKFRIGGKRFENVWHEVDLTKQEIMSEYGGAAFDMDVFVVNGERIFDILKNYQCMVSQEGSGMLNAGFIACNLDAEFPKRLIRSYKEDYRQDWWYNSAVLPLKIHKEEGFNKTVFIDDTISDHPHGGEKHLMLEKDGHVKWWEKVGQHSFYHDKNFVNESLYQAPETSFKWMLRWILDKQHNDTLSPADNFYAHFNATT